jgi:hypothetical protein
MERPVLGRELNTGSISLFHNSSRRRRKINLFVLGSPKLFVLHLGRLVPK